MMKNAIYSILLLFALTGCIEPFSPKTEGIDSILVVEGIITNETTQIALSYSVGLDKELNSTITENRALVYVECDDGSRSELTGSSGDGMYLIETGELNAIATYRLVIQLAGEEYRSGYIVPAITPPVNVSFTHDNHISIRVSTTGDAHQPGYYLWSYREDWEVHAIVYSEWVPVSHYPNPQTGRWEMMYNDLYSPNNRYYCWRTDSSKVLILGATEKLSENIIREREIKSFAFSDDRISVLYRIRIRQNVLHKEAYDYFENLQKNTEQTGNIFGSIPTELMGNIRCVSNPAMPVIGYVDVSTTTTNELYLTNAYYDSTNRNRDIASCNEAEEMPVSCIDCTWYGTKRKPKDWPNDHH